MGLRAPADGSGRIYPSEMTYAQFKKRYQYFASPFTKAIAVMQQYDVCAHGRRNLHTPYADPPPSPRAAASPY